MINNFIDGELDIPYVNQKKLRKRDYIEYMSERLLTMFEWKNLPDTVPYYVLEHLLQWGGNACIFKYDGEIYATFGGLGGERDYNYEPTIYTIANPYLNYSAALKIGVDCVRMRNDSLGKGLLPMHIRYSDLMVENDITIRVADIIRRADHGIIADNDRSYESAQDFLSSIEDGKLAPIASEEFFNGVTDIDTTKTNITDLIELQQYLKASWFNELGLNANYNMKRERIAAPEAQMMDASLLPLAEQMLEMRKRGCDLVNKMFGTDWEVDFSGAWRRETQKQDGDPGEITENQENSENGQEDTEENAFVEDTYGDDFDDSTDVVGDDVGGSNDADDNNEDSINIDVDIIVDTNGDGVDDLLEKEVQENEEETTD